METNERRNYPFAQTVGTKVARIRETRGISQEELGFRAEMHRTAIGQLERGERAPRLDSAVKISAALGVPVDALVEGIQWTPAILTVGGFSFGQSEAIRDAE